MSPRPSLAARLRRLLVLAMALMMLGTASAAAYWTAQAQAGTRATAATVGLEQTLLPAGGTSPLAGDYGTSSTLAGAVRATNSGSRAAVPALTVRAAGTSSPALTGALRIAVGVLTDSASCTPQTVLAGARTGALGTRITLPEHTVAPGTAAVLCVQTTLPAASGGSTVQRLDLELTSSLAYAEGTRWTVDASTPIAVTQTIAADTSAGAQPMTPGGQQDGWYLSMAFPQNAGKQGSTTYRASLAWAESPGTRVSYASPPTGWDTEVRFNHGSAPVRAFTATRADGTGNAWLYVEMSTDGGRSWTPAAVGTLRFATDASTVKIYAGWS